MVQTLFPGRQIGQKSRPLRLLYTSLVLILASFCGLAAYMLAELRRDTLTSAIRTSDNLLSAVADDIARNVEMYDLSLQAVVAGIQLPGVGVLDTEMRRAVLFDRAATARYLGSILVLDEAGSVVEDSGSSPPRPANLGDRQYFQAHKAGTSGLFISRPFRRRVTGPGDLVIALSRPIYHLDGSFAGVVVGTLRLDYLRDLFARFQVGRHGSVSLLSTDGIVLMRTPYNEEVIGRDISATDNFRRSLEQTSGTFDGTPSLDGIRRVYNHQRVGALPLVLLIGLAEAEIYETWWIRATVISAVLLVLCLGTGWLSLLLVRELRRRARAEKKMRCSEAQYRLLADHTTDVIMHLGADLSRQYVSPASFAVLGYSAAELAGTNPASTTHPDDWPALSRMVDNVRQSRGSAEATYRFRHKDGHWVWIEAKLSYLPGDGGFSVVLRDIGRRKQAEQQLEAANAELARIAVTDGLTGLVNRRGFDQTFKTEWRLSLRNSTSLSLLLLDVDQFKMFNDRYGHLDGDQCLQNIAGVVARAAQRPGDVAARYGGEELALLLPGADEAGAASVAEAVRAGVAALRIPHEDSAEAAGVVTASIGVASMMASTGQTAPSMRDLISAADNALYHAKRTGRNRVVCASHADAASALDAKTGHWSAADGSTCEASEEVPAAAIAVVVNSP